MLDFTLDAEETCAASTRAAEVGRGTAGLPATGEEPGCFSWDDETERARRCPSSPAMFKSLLKI